MTEFVASVLAYGFPAQSGLRVSHSADKVTLVRNGNGQVINSVRTVAPLTGPVDSLVWAVRQLVGDVAATIREQPHAPGQSLLGTGLARYAGPAAAPWYRTRVIARLETVAGPVIAGTGDGQELVPEPDAFPARLDSHRLPQSWTSLPIVLMPQVTSILMSGARLALTSSQMRQRYPTVAGSRIMNNLTIVDRPALHDESADDDAGDPAQAHTLVAGGRLCAVPFSPVTNTIAGRAVWDHDVQMLGRAATARLELTGPELMWPADPVEIAWCVEGLQRYHRDGTVRLRCLGLMPGHPGGWHVFELRARPLGLLRLAIGVTGAARHAFSEDEVTTPSLVLPSAAELEKKNGAILTAI